MLSVMEYPDSVFRLLAEGGSAYEKRVIINLAKVSRITNEDGTIRPFIDFKNDWEYTESIYGRADTCQLCGKHPIKENCVLHDAGTGHSIIVGNVCVHRYIDIVVDGITLTEDEKTDFLRENMNKAKAAYRKALWEKTHPDVMDNLAYYEDWMTETYGKWKPKPTTPALESLHRRLTNRLVKYGFPGPKLWEEWEQFLWRAPAGHAAWQKTVEVRVKERAAIEKEKADARARFETALAHDRVQWRRDSTNFTDDIQTGKENGFIFSGWHQKMFAKITSNLSYGMTLSPERQRLFDFVQICAGKAHPPAPFTESYLKAKNAWEKNFVLSIWLQVDNAKPLSSRQQEVLDGINKRTVTA